MGTDETVARHTPGPEFTDHLVALTEAIGRVQPLADYRGNFAALHAVCVLDEAIAAVLGDIAPWVDNAGARALAPEMRREVEAALAEHAAEQHMGGDCPCEICDRRRALLARLDA